MKIAILMNHAIPWSRDTALMLARLGHAVHAIDFAVHKTARGHLLTGDAFQSDDIRRFSETIALHLLDSRFPNDVRYFTTAPALRRLLDRIRPDVLLTLYAGGFATMAMLSTFRPYCPWVVGSDVLLANGWKARLLGAALTNASLVLANGDYLAEKTRELAPRARVEPLLLGIDVTQYSVTAKPSGPVRILSNRGFIPVYQNDHIVRGLQYLDPTCAGDYRFLFTSAGPELEAVQALADRILPAPVKERVTFAGGVSQREMLDSLASSHVFLSMARSDGTATALLEAMASGLYPVVTDIPQNREWVRPEWNNGLLVPLGDPRALAAALKTALTGARGAAEAIAFNRHQVEQRANAQRNMDALTTLLKGIA